MEDGQQFAANWYPDPLGRYDHRWYDGAAWTDQVSSGGTRLTDPEGVRPTVVPSMGTRPDKIRDQVHRQAHIAPGSAGVGGGTLFDEPILVVNQKAKLLELTNEYAVYDQHGHQIGAVRQVGQSTLRKAARLLLDVDQFLTHRLEVVDPGGRTLLRLTRPAKIFKSTVVVTDAAGSEIGRIIQRNVFGKIRFDLQSDGQTVGGLNAENWRAWDFHVVDHTGGEIARVKKTWEGLAKTLFTTADNYVVRVHRPLADPLRSLVVGAALAIDTALKQDSRGLS